MKRLLKRFAWNVFVYLGIPGIAFGCGYGWLAKTRLDTALAQDQLKSWSVASYEIIDKTQSKVETSFSSVLRVAVKQKDGANYRPFGHGLVHAVFDLSPGTVQWAAVAPTLDEEAEALKLRGLSVLPPGHLIDRLEDPAEHVREVASTLLRQRTGQDFGYRHDRPIESQKAAIEKWRSWWEINKLSWAADKALEGVGEILKSSKDSRGK